MWNIALFGGLIQDAIPGNGEDAVCSQFGEQTALIACMDGCGGSGAQRYEQAGNCKGARIASHEVGETLKEFFSVSGIAREGFSHHTDQAVASMLHSCIDVRLAQVSAKLSGGSTKSRLKSRLALELPTTLAMLLAEPDRENADAVRSMAVWAGDSRVYAFLPEGLRQLSEDDIVGGADAEENLTTDGIMSNAVNASGKYRINIRRQTLRGPVIYLTATDGCFAYFPSPIMFEGVLLSTLAASETPNEWMLRLSDRIGEVAADDYSLQYVAFARDTDDFTSIKRMYAERRRSYEQRYGEPLRALLEQRDRAGMQALWLEYKREYSFCQEARNGGLKCQ